MTVKELIEQLTRIEDQDLIVAEFKEATFNNPECLNLLTATHRVKMNVYTYDYDTPVSVEFLKMHFGEVL